MAVHLSDTGFGVGVGLALGVAFELATHVLVHYTIPGASFAANLAMSLAPALDSVGLTTVFSESAGAAATAGSAVVESLPSLSSLGA